MPADGLIRTTGEVFADASMIEPILNHNGLTLLHWSGQTATIASRISRASQVYASAGLDPTILRDMRMPTHAAPHQSARQLLKEIAATMQHHTGMAENSAMLVGHFVLANWLVGGLPAAPQLVISGPDALGGTQLLRLLHCLCRRPLLLTEVDVNGICSLPMAWRPTLLIHQRVLSRRMEQLLNAVQERDVPVLRGGRLIDLHCATVTYAEPRSSRAPCKLYRVEIPMLATYRNLPALDDAARKKIADDFQPRLLAYRLENYTKVCRSGFDVREFISPTRELVRCLGACTPDDPERQARLIQLLKGQDIEYRSERWTDLNTVIVEALLAYIHERELD